ncbi:tctex1 domain-containing protein 1-like [Dendronephthya gigantea]|uniref:tctex1 domain-containing protein 1-like n=1 Tax=Dendronephthya gigantea TaxID=151771 RepID=UPI00106A18D9|nr:tctex1 domain-containing protein 1-like [Dendronephthya gigantea]
MLQKRNTTLDWFVFRYQDKKANISPITMEGFNSYYHKGYKTYDNDSSSGSDYSSRTKRRGVQLNNFNNNVFLENGKPKAKHVPNTMQLKPNCKVESRKIREIISEVLRRNLWEESYDADRCNLVAMMTSEQIKSAVKLLDMPRYKIVCVVTVGSKSGQHFLQASRCLSNTEYDAIISESFDNGSVFAVGVVYAFYQE